MANKVYSLLGIATRAGRTKSGGFLCEEAVQKGAAKLVIITTDAQKNTVKSLTDKCRTKNVGVRFYGTKEELGHAMGKELRSCVCITDEGFAKSIREIIDRKQSADQDISKERGTNGENKD